MTQNGAATRLYRNASPRSGLRIRLQGNRQNPDAIGATVRLRYSETELGPVREIQAGSGYWSQNSSVPVLGTNRTATAVSVNWPDGRKTETPFPSGMAELVIPHPSE